MDGHYHAYQVYVVAERNTVFSTVYHVERVALFHWGIRNISANLADQVCHDVRVEHPLETLAGGAFGGGSANKGGEAAVARDISGADSGFRVK